MWDIDFFSTTGANGNFLVPHASTRKLEESNAISAKTEIFRQLKSWVIVDGKRLTGKLGGVNDDGIISLGIFSLFGSRVENSQPNEPYYIYKQLPARSMH